MYIATENIVMKHLGIFSVGHVTFEGWCASSKAYQFNLVIVIVFCFLSRYKEMYVLRSKAAKKKYLSLF